MPPRKKIEVSGEGVDDIVARLQKELKISIGYGTGIPDTINVFTGNPLVDSIMLVGRGVPSGSITQVTGQPGCGKSMFTKNWLRSLQDQFPDKSVVVIASEFGDYTSEALTELGFDLDRIIIIESGTAEDQLQALMTLLIDPNTQQARNLISGWAIDSLPALVPTAVMETRLADSTVRSPHASLMHRFLPPISLGQGNTIGIIVNQLRDTMATGPGSGAHIFGGKAPGYWPKLSLKFTKHDFQDSSRSGPKWNEKIAESFSVTVRAEKNNLRGHGREGVQVTYSVNLEKIGCLEMGVDREQCIVRAATVLGIIEKAGSWNRFTLNDKDYSLQGEDKTVATVKAEGLGDQLLELTMAAAREQFSVGARPTRTIDPETGEVIDLETGEVIQDISENN
jgi:RecA/RadA recombinase